MVLELLSGDKESASNWREFFKDLKTRGLNKRAVTLGIMDACLTFFNFTEEEWISLRITNIIERLNKEFKRRTKPMEIVAGENACYTLLSFICIKMELHWRSNPLGKVHNNWPYFKKMPHENFTQKT